MGPADMTAEAVRACVDGLRHDLGKYVAWISANLPDEAFGPPPSPEAVAALQADVLATRRDRSGRPLAAWEVYERWVAGIADEDVRAALAPVTRAVDTLRAAGPALARGDGSALAAHIPAIRAAQRVIRAKLRALSRSLRGGAH